VLCAAYTTAAQLGVQEYVARATARPDVQPEPELSCLGSADLGLAAELVGLVLPLPVPCVYYDPCFLLVAQADDFLAALAPAAGGTVAWATSARCNHATAIYGDPGVEYHYKAGYASTVRGPHTCSTRPLRSAYLTCTGQEVHAWTPELLSIRRRVTEWHATRVGRPVYFNVCLLNRYDGGEQALGSAQAPRFCYPPCRATLYIYAGVHLTTGSGNSAAPRTAGRWHADREEMDPALDAPRGSPIASVSLGTPRQFGLQRCGAGAVRSLLMP
jgi:hypothetical protein